MSQNRKTSIPAPDFEELSAYLDCELPAARLAEIDQWLETQPGVRAELAALRAFERRLKRRVDEAAAQAPSAEIVALLERLKGGAGG